MGMSTTTRSIQGPVQSGNNAKENISPRDSLAGDAGQSTGPKVVPQHLHRPLAKL